MDLIAWFDHRIASCEQRATQVDDELKFVYLDAARDNREARDAVAELIDCVGDAQSLLSEIDSAVRAEHAKNGHPKSQSIAGIINYRLTAALSRIGGAK